MKALYKNNKLLCENGLPILLNATTPSGTLNIGSNGTYDVFEKASVSVNVPQTITPKYLNVLPSGSVSSQGTTMSGFSTDKYIQVAPSINLNQETTIIEYGLKIILSKSNTAHSLCYCVPDGVSSTAFFCDRFRFSNGLKMSFTVNANRYSWHSYSYSFANMFNGTDYSFIKHIYNPTTHSHTVYIRPNITTTDVITYTENQASVSTQGTSAFGFGYPHNADMSAHSLNGDTIDFSDTYLKINDGIVWGAKTNNYEV